MVVVGDPALNLGDHRVVVALRPPRAGERKLPLAVVAEQEDLGRADRLGSAREARDEVKR